MLKYFLSSLLLILNLNSMAQEDSLFRTLQQRDSLLFNIGFNKCDISQFRQLVSEDFEFYHDIAGITNSKAAFIKSIEEGICRLPYKPRRELVPGSLEVYPLKKNDSLYGAMQTGIHRFYSIEKDQPEHLTSVAKFSHIWLLQNRQWKLSRAYSYDHKEKDATLFKDRITTEEWMAAHKIPIVGIGYIQNGKITETTVYGKLDNDKPAPVNTIFNVASLTKPVTAIVALKLVDAGKWNLDEPLYKYWLDPDIAKDPSAKKLTTRYILSHRSGFPNWRDSVLTFQFEPGTKYQYSGEGFEYLRRALENKFHKTLDQFAAELIFKPLQMNDTRYYWDMTVDSARFATWHKKDGSLYKTYKNKSANAADDLLTTIEDYSKFVLYIMNGAGLSKELYTQMISEQVRIKTNKYWGLSWYVDELANNNTAIMHGGDDKGVHTMAFILPHSKEGLIIFTNSDNGTEAYYPILPNYLGKAGQDIIDVETK